MSLRVKVTNICFVTLTEIIMVRRKFLEVGNNSVTVEGNQIRIGTDAWYKWLDTVDGFYYVPSEYNPFTVKNRNGYWYCYKTVSGKQRNKYL